MKACVLPPPLRPGDHLWVTLPSGTLRELTDWEKGLEVWRSRGYHLHLSAHYQDRCGYLAGTDLDRRTALAEGLINPQYRGVLTGRGGYGGARLLEAWQWPLDTCKWVVGFSDITALLWHLAQQGIASLHGPVITTLAAEPQDSQQRLFDYLEGRPVEPLRGEGWGKGTVTGILLPGNLTVATHLLGTALMPDLTDVILALEEVGEVPYRLDRMLTQWRLSGLLDVVKGIALGRFSRCQPPLDQPSWTVEEVLRDRLGSLGIPIVSSLAFGHDGANPALPVGVVAHLDADRGVLSIPQP
ncbi:MAG: LD-carboxypeptidase [Acaryochloridaceae cyanobacterium SU_2_1]|nr:LD-carboxypeptidase [Acaryochloridaceae cyanobacterium SU_2_1]NJM95040.1 LD-carboxypeptidase [Acaryochloridaceae cyanobacterium CSU_5_19]